MRCGWRLILQQTIYPDKKMKIDKCGLIIKTSRKNQNAFHSTKWSNMQIAFDDEFLTCFECNNLYCDLSPG